ncbi:MAG: AraC family transcriptional regulator [Trebonia sp.]
MTVIDESVRRLPAPSLRPFVEWYVGFRQAGVAPARHRGLPSPALTFILTLDDPLVVAAHADPRQPPGEYTTLLGGLHTAPALITHEGRQSGIQLALTPLGARALLGLPAAQFANLDVDAEAVLGGFARELRERIAARETWAGRFGVLDAVLGQRVADRGVAGASGSRGSGSGASVSHAYGLGVRPEVGYAWHRLRAASGAVRISALAAETGWSERYLNARFRAETGLAPKEAARVFRFTAARQRIARAATGVVSGGVVTGGVPPGGGLSLADLAAECGYFDQAHLAREFRSLAGCPPTQWLAEEFRNVQASVADLGE